MSSVGQVMQGMVNVELQGVIRAKDEMIRIKEDHVHHLTMSNRRLEDEVARLKSELQIAQKSKNPNQELEHYKNLLSRPLAEIAEKNEAFRANYEVLATTVASWMVSQKAFKELAISLASEKGLSSDDVIQMGRKKMFDVLENRHADEHGSNAKDFPMISKYADAVRKNANEALAKRS